MQYDPASHLTNATFPSGTETWVYNTLQQLQHRTTISGGTRMDMTYNYTAGANNGQILNTVDAVTGETITYQYDSLKRLAAATSKVSGTLRWSEVYTYDGLGNLTGMTPGGSGAPSLSVTVNPATNQISPANIAYDGNGNVTQFGPSGTLTTLGYDVANRVATVNSTNAYAYDSANQRVYFRNSAGAETLYVYGADGKKLATYTIAGITGSQVNFTWQSQNVYFAGKLISAEGNPVAVDRLGSVRWSAASNGTSHTYYPYGVEYSATTNDTEKYATYTRDNLTGQDYAVNRYYSSQWGRFLSPDPYMASAKLGNPQTWNRYAYVDGDPVNAIDSTGLCGALLAGINMAPGSMPEFDDLSGELSAMTAYPYSHSANGSMSGMLLGGASVISQGVFGRNASTETGIEALSAMASEGGGIVYTYSGGAQVLKAAFPNLSQSERDSIHGIVYIAPGAIGGLPLSPNGPTVVITGRGAQNVLAGLPTSISSKILQISTNCAHTDVQCFAITLDQVRNKIISGSVGVYDTPCDLPLTFTELRSIPSYFPFGPSSYWYWYGYPVPAQPPGPIPEPPIYAP